MRPLPKILEKLAMYFPVVHLGFIGMALILFFWQTHLGTGLILLFAIYFLPVLLWRFLNIFYPIKVGVSHLGIKEEHGNSWILAHRLQYLFITFPSLERIMIVIPGAFSLWLRMWGSKIGKSVMWTPRIDIVDRTHLEIGDYSFIGDKTYITSHFIRRKNNRLVLFFKHVKIEDRAMIGYSCVLGPGTVISAKQDTPAMSQAMFGRIVSGAEWT